MKITLISKINPNIKTIVYPIDNYGSDGAGYHFELNDKALSPMELIKLGFEKVIIELRSTAHKKAFNTNYYDNLLNQLNPDSIPMIDTDLYKWMKSGNYNDNIIDNKINYLESKGFIKGKDKLSESVIRKLGYIHNHYFIKEVLKK